MSNQVNQVTPHTAIMESKPLNSFIPPMQSRSPYLLRESKCHSTPNTAINSIQQQPHWLKHQASSNWQNKPFKNTFQKEQLNKQFKLKRTTNFKRNTNHKYYPHSTFTANNMNSHQEQGTTTASWVRQVSQKAYEQHPTNQQSDIVARMQPILYEQQTNFKSKAVTDLSKSKNSFNPKSKANGIQKQEKRKRKRMNKNRKSRAQRQWASHQASIQCSQAHPQKNYNHRKVFLNSNANYFQRSAQWRKVQLSGKKFKDECTWYALNRPSAPHNTTSFLCNNYLCRPSTGNRSGLFMQTRPHHWSLDASKSIEAERVAEHVNNPFPVKATNQTQYLYLGGSQLSTTAGESSADEDLLELRLSQPGLTMQGNIFKSLSTLNVGQMDDDVDMFELSLDEDEESKKEVEYQDVRETTQYDETDDFSEAELNQAMESQNMMISSLQKELEAKTRMCQKYQVL